jgi:predicted ATPase with chaperone activity
LTLAEAVETTRIHRVAGLSGDRTALVATPLCRAPHHTLSDVGRIGGGHVPLPGEVSLAYHGVRCLDELPEFRCHVLEMLRQPFEDGITPGQFPLRCRLDGIGGAGRANDNALRVARDQSPPCTRS